MESTSSPPVKKIRLSEVSNITQCVREFTLPQQFPSMVSTKESTVLVRGKNSAGTLPKKIKLVPCKDPQTQLASLQKLRIKSADGKDLGEVNVKVLSQDNNVFKHVDKMVMLNKNDVSKQENNMEKVKSPEKEKDAKNISYPLKVIPLKNLTVAGSNRLQESGKTLPEKLSVPVDSRDACRQEKEVGKVVSTDNENVKSTYFMPPNDKGENNIQLSTISAQKYMKIPQNSKVVVMGLKNSAQLIGNKTATLSNSKMFQNSNILTISDKKQLQGFKAVENKKLVGLKVPLEKCKMVSPDILLKPLTSTNGKDQKENSSSENVSKNAVVNTENVGLNSRNNIESNIDNNSKCVINNRDAVTQKENGKLLNTQEQTTAKVRENVMVVIHKDKKVILNAASKPIKLEKSSLKPADNKNVDSKSNEASMKMHDTNSSAVVSSTITNLPTKNDVNSTSSAVSSSITKQLTSSTVISTESTDSSSSPAAVSSTVAKLSTSSNDITKASASSSAQMSARKSHDSPNSKLTFSSTVTKETQKKSNSVEIINESESDSVSSSISKESESTEQETKINIIQKENNTQEENSMDPLLRKKLDQWSIIERAVSSINDSELRAEALKALADCGIGLEKHVPVTKDLKVVHDSQIQTDVFSLLDPNSFVLVNKDSLNIERIKYTECALNSVHSITQSKLTQNGLLSNENTVFTANNDLMTNLDFFDFDKFFEEHCSDNAAISRVRQVLSPPSQPEEHKVCIQLKKDFMTAKQIDENGFLNIHKAVISNRFYDVQRHVMVLKALKEHVDVPTQSGQTSLELAIIHDASDQIVNSLLKAGAQPVSSELAHDSALIIACKKSSPLVTELVNHVSARNLLNQIDSSGFAALHYCALYGNLKGVAALVRAGADINLKDYRSGRTAFFHALENNQIAIAQYLIENGAIANIPNFAGQTVLSIIDDIKSLSLRTLLKRTPS